MFRFFTSVIQSVKSSPAETPGWAAYIQNQITVQSSMICLRKSVLRVSRNVCRLLTCPETSADSLHVLHTEYQLMPSCRRFRVPSFKRIRFKLFCLSVRPPFEPAGLESSVIVTQGHDLRQGGSVFTSVCLSVCLSVSDNSKSAPWISGQRGC